MVYANIFYIELFTILSIQVRIIIIHSSPFLFFISYFIYPIANYALISLDLAKLLGAILSTLFQKDYLTSFLIKIKWKKLFI